MLPKSTRDFGGSGRMVGKHGDHQRTSGVCGTTDRPSGRVVRSATSGTRPHFQMGAEGNRAGRGLVAGLSRKPAEAERTDKHRAASRRLPGTCRSSPHPYLIRTTFRSFRHVSFSIWHSHTNYLLWSGYLNLRSKSLLLGCENRFTCTSLPIRCNERKVLNQTRSSQWRS